MINLPDTTKVDRFIAKEKFYAKTEVNASLQRLFTNQVAKMIWKYKISPETLNISFSSYQELQVFEILLKGQELDNAVLKHIDQSIPYPILFILKRTTDCKAIMAYKEMTSSTVRQTRVICYLETSWRPVLELELEGQSVDEIYRHYLMQIEPTLSANKGLPLFAVIEIYREQHRIQKQIAAYQKKIAKEPSIAKKQELARERYELQRYLEENKNLEA